MSTSFILTPVGVSTITRPATERGRSIQGAISIPPYFSVDRRIYLLSSSPFSLILKLGRSEWLADSRKPAGSPWGIRKAMTVLMLRVM